ncbi:hypothetical protein ABIB62_003782 [Mucilaginibacter sp. UYP25]|uniref:hypothetical protein n=1 Tax=unclassified Mucilaginibacter TaxID=2617802 RepID=UPI00339B14C7
MSESYQLPESLQIIVAISAIVSSFGVVVALIQIAIAKGQFKTQLEVTSNQFYLLNQGYLSIDTRSALYSPQLAPGSPMVPGITYESISISASLENVGNTPIIYEIDQCVFKFNGLTVYKPTIKLSDKGVLYPKQIATFGLGQTPFTNLNELLTTDAIQALNITCVFSFKYNDFNSNVIKTIERTLEVRVDDYRITGIYSQIGDTI